MKSDGLLIGSEIETAVMIGPIFLLVIQVYLQNVMLQQTVLNGVHTGFQ